MIDAVERRSQVGIQRPRALAGLAPCGHEGGLHRVLAAAARPEPVRSGFEPGLPLGLQRADRQGLQCPVGDHGNPEPAPFSVCLRDVNPPDGAGLPRGRAVLQPGGHGGLLPAREHDPPVNPGRLAASIDLRHPAHAHQSARTGPEHQPLQATDLLQVPCLTCREDPLPQPPYVVLGPGPVNRVPVRNAALRSVHRSGVQRAHRSRPLRSPDRHRLTWPTSAPFRAGHLPVSGRLCGASGGGARARPRFPAAISAAGLRFLGHPVPAGEAGSPCGRPSGGLARRTPTGLLCCT